MKIRKLNAGDVKLIATLMARNLSSLVGATKKQEGEADDDHTTRVGITIIGQVLVEHMDDLWAWLANLIGVSAEELNNMEPSAPLEIIDALLASPDLPDFFERVGGLLERKKVGLLSGTK